MSLEDFLDSWRYCRRIAGFVWERRWTFVFGVGFGFGFAVAYIRGCG